MSIPWIASGFVVPALVWLSPSDAPVHRPASANSTSGFASEQMQLASSQTHLRGTSPRQAALAWRSHSQGLEEVSSPQVAIGVESLSQAITDDRLGLGEIWIGAPEQALQSLGEPLRDQRSPSPNYESLRSLTYADLEVIVADGLVAVLITESAEFPTLEGVRVGDSRQQVIDTYGINFEESTEGDLTRLAYYSVQGSILTFALVGDRVIGIYCGWLLD